MYMLPPFLFVYVFIVMFYAKRGSDFPEVCQTLQIFTEHNLATTEGNRNGPLQSGFYKESWKNT